MVGGYHACALDGGDAYCWGGGGGRLGSGTTSDQAIPVAVTMPTDVSFNQLTASYYHTCALDDGGNAYCWGSGGKGQLGNGGFSNQTAPVAVTMPAGVSFNQLTVGYRHTCAVSSNGNAYCWGYSDDGQLGNGNSINSQSAPIAVLMPTGITFNQLAAGYSSACAVGSNDNVYCWGDGDNGQLGNGNFSEQATPVVVLAPR